MLHLVLDILIGLGSQTFWRKCPEHRFLSARGERGVRSEDKRLGVISTDKIVTSALGAGPLGLGKH